MAVVLYCCWCIYILRPFWSLCQIWSCFARRNGIGHWIDCHFTTYFFISLSVTTLDQSWSKMCFPDLAAGSIKDVLVLNKHPSLISNLILGEIPKFYHYHCSLSNTIINYFEILRCICWRILQKSMRKDKKSLDNKPKIPMRYYEDWCEINKIDAESRNLIQNAKNLTWK